MSKGDKRLIQLIHGIDMNDYPNKALLETFIFSAFDNDDIFHLFNDVWMFRVGLDFSIMNFSKKLKSIFPEDFIFNHIIMEMSNRPEDSVGYTFNSYWKFLKNG